MEVEVVFPLFADDQSSHVESLPFEGMKLTILKVDGVAYFLLDADDWFLFLINSTHILQVPEYSSFKSIDLHTLNTFIVNKQLSLLIKLIG